jgi:hypothetical protein
MLLVERKKQFIAERAFADNQQLSNMTLLRLRPYPKTCGTMKTKTNEVKLNHATNTTLGSER